jgi:23S rRNA (cytosine1962-C5)-methyltransferase
MLTQSLRLGGHARATSLLFPSFCGSGQLTSLCSSAASGDDKFVVVRRDSAKVVRSGNPIIFDGSIERSTLRKEGLKSGDFVRILDEKKNCLAKGFYNRTSMYSVRVLVTEGSNLMNIDCWETILKERILTAVRRRIELCLAKATDCYRLVNGEGDMLSGLIVDQVGESCIIIQSSAYWTEKHRGLIINIFNELFNNESGSADQKVKIIFTTHANRVRQDGFTGPCPELQEEERAVLHDKVITENGLKFKVFSSTNPAFTTIQKTGFYCDQRENRLLVRSLSRGKSVLDLYCYSGGFSLNAWVGGASEYVLLMCRDDTVLPCYLHLIYHACL